MSSNSIGFKEILKEISKENKWKYSTYSKIDPEVKRNFPFQNPRKNQLETISEIKQAIDNGFKYIILEAGTGTGKSAIAATLASMYDSTYILTVTKQLQEQYLNDFSNLGFKLVKGRGNFKCKKYAQENVDLGCDEGRCVVEGYKCEYSIKDNHIEISEANVCEYDFQKFQGLISDVVISNYHYLFLELNYVEDFTERTLMIFDEAHNIENSIMSQLKLEIDRKDLKEYIGVNLSKQTVKELCDGDYTVWIEFIKKIKDKYQLEYDKIKNVNKTELKRKRLYLKKRIDDCERFISHISHDPDKWIFDYDKYWGVGEFKPVKIDQYAKDTFFRYADVCIFMSATILDYKLFASWLGIDESEIYAIRKKSPFDIKRNPIITSDDFDMSYSNLNSTAPKTVFKVNEILNNHENEKGIIHTISYGCKNFLVKHVKSDRFITHKTHNRLKQLNKFKKSTEPLVLISPSMGEGVDLPGDLCRFQIIYKMPYPNISDKQTSKRMRMDSKWFKYRTALSLVQTVGRGMRYDDDYCTTYFLDKRLKGFILTDSISNNFLPDSFKQAIDIEVIEHKSVSVSDKQIIDVEVPKTYSALSKNKVSLPNDSDYMDNIERKYELTIKGLNLLEDEKYSEAIDFYRDLVDHELFAHDYHPYLKLSKAYDALKEYEKEADILERFFNSGIYCRNSTLKWFKKQLKRLSTLGYFDYSKITDLESIYKKYGKKNRKLSKSPVPLAVDIKAGRKKIRKNPKVIDPKLFDDKVRMNENASYDEKVKFKYELVKYGEKLINEKKRPKAIGYYNRLLSHELFENDYHPYRKLSQLYRKDKQPDAEIELLTKFFTSGIYCSEKQLKWFKNRLGQLSNYGLFDPSKINGLVMEFYRRALVNKDKTNSPVPIAIDIKNHFEGETETIEQVKESDVKYSRKYFNDLANNISQNPDFISDRELLKHTDDDFVYIGKGNNQLNLKADLKNEGKILESEDKFKAIEFYDELKKNELFEKDYWPYRRQCILFKNKIKDNAGDWNTIKEIFENKIPLNSHQYVWLNNKVLELIVKLDLNDSEINEMENLLQNFEKNHENYKMPSIPIAEKIIKEEDGTVKVLSDEKYDYLQEIFYVKELGVGYIRRCDYENAIPYYLKLLENEFLYFQYHAYKQLGRIYDEMDDNDEFVRLYNKFK